MDDIQQQFERGVADRFFDWFTLQGRSPFSFSRRAGDAPDLVYASGTYELQVEVTAAYYDGAHATFLWKNAQGAEDAPIGWERFDAIPAEKALAQAIVKQVTVKCKKRYGANTLLLVEVPPGITSVEELSGLLTRSTFPSVIPFSGVYVAGRFPITSRSRGGYRVLPIKELPANPTIDAHAHNSGARRLA